MATAPSFADLITQGEAELLARRPDLSVHDGDVTEADLHAAAAMGDAVIRFAALAFKETFIDGAEGDALTLLVNDHLGLARQLASSAQVVLSFTRTSGGAGGTIPAGTTVASLHDPSGKQVRFTTDADFVVGGTLNGPFSVNATAEVAGRDGNAAAATITKIVDTLFDGTFTVTNAAAAAGGNDEESDEALRRRAKTFFQTLRRGTLAALEFGALEVSTVRVASASEDFDTGLVTLLVGDGDGNSTVQMVEAVEAEEESWRAAGVSLTVVGGAKSEVAIAFTLLARAGFDIAAATPAIQAAVIARGNKQLPGATLYLDVVKSAVISTFPDDLERLTFTSITVDGVAQALTADVVPASGKVLRIVTVGVS